MAFVVPSAYADSTPREAISRDEDGRFTVGESITFGVCHDEGVGSFLIRSWWRRFADVGVVLVVPPVEEFFVGVPRLQGFPDDRTLVVPKEVIAVNFVLNLSAVVALLFEPECVVGDVSCGVTGIFEPRLLTRLDADLGTCGLRDFFDTHNLTIVSNDNKRRYLDGRLQESCTFD